MDQISNFREVLGLDRQPSNPVQEQTPDVEPPHQVKEKKTSSPKVKQNKKSKETSNDYADAKTIRVMPHVHRKLKLMGLWLDSAGVMTNPSANDIISMALDALIDGGYPKAKGFVNK